VANSRSSPLLDAALAHHLLEIAVAHSVAAIPAHRPEHDLAFKMASLEVRHSPALSTRTSLEPNSQRVCNICGRPQGCKENRSGLMARRLGADICPATDAAVHLPRARMGVREPGPNQSRVLEGTLLQAGFLVLSLDPCAILSFRPPYALDDPTITNKLTPSRPELCRPLPWRAARRRSGLSCWPTPPSPASAACAPAFGRATILQARPSRRPGAPPRLPR
jgi:hypothetical protein